MSKVFLVTGMEFGDEGKGSLVDYLSHIHKPHTVIRHNGGAQAAHNVVRPGNIHHTFQQFGSGTFEGAHTYLSEYMLIEPGRLLDEALSLSTKGVSNVLGLMKIDPRALVITPFHREMNQLRERMRGTSKHGSTGLGVGETRSFSIDYPDQALRIGDIRNRKLAYEKLVNIANHYADEARYTYEIDVKVNWDLLDIFLDILDTLHKSVNVPKDPDEWLHRIMHIQDGCVIFEGAQGVLLDEWYGFYPHTTWTDTTTRNARRMIEKYEYKDEVESIGVMRTYMTRHGAGPFPTESKILANSLPEEHNGTSEFTGSMRIGWPDLLMLRYALEVSGGIDSLAITHWDSLAYMPYDDINLAIGYFGDGGATTSRISVPKEFPVDLVKQEALTKRLFNSVPYWRKFHRGYFKEVIQDSLSLPANIVARGPTWKDKMVSIDKRQAVMV